MEKKVTLREQLAAFERGQVLSTNGRTDDTGCWNFYDWFCKESSLKNKAVSLMKKVKRFVTAHNIDLDKHYVWFKNNCPMRGSLYDDFRISDIETGENKYVVTAKSGHTGMAEWHGPENRYTKPILSGKKFSDLLVPINQA